VRAKSSLESVFITWDEGVPGDIPILGFRLSLHEFATGQTRIVYEQRLNSDVKQVLVPDLETGALYSFFVEAFDLNTVSPRSSELVVPVCLAPDHIDRVNLIGTSRTSITLGWEAP
jgi:hypothetical protein